MSENRLPDYLGHMQQAATDACGFVEGLGKDDFLADKRTVPEARAGRSRIGALGSFPWRYTL